MAREKICGIYCIENLVNEKKYVGQSKDISLRWKQHKNMLNKNYHYNKYLQRSWSKYGVHNFTFYILEECNISDLNGMETNYMGKYNVTNSKYGYNLNSSPDGHVRCNDEYRFKLKVLQIDYLGKIIKEWNSVNEIIGTTVYKERSIRSCLINETMSYKDYFWTYKKDYIDFDLEYKISMSKRINPVIQLDFDLNKIKTYINPISAENETGFRADGISMCCLHKISKSEGYKWEYLSNYNTGNTNNKIIIREKPVIKCDKNGDLIEKYNTIKEASDKTGTSESCIVKCCNGNRKTANKYTWKYDINLQDV